MHLSTHAPSLPSPASELISAAGAQLTADAYDQAAWMATVQASPRLQQAIQSSQQRVRTAPSLLRDLFWSLYKAVPTLTTSSSSPIDIVHRQLLQQVMQTSEWQELRALGSVGDPVSSAMGTLTLAEGLVIRLSQETVDYLNHVHALQEQIQALLNQTEGLQAATEQCDPTQAERLAALAAQQYAQAQTHLTQLSTLLQQRPPTSVVQPAAVRQAARAALRQAGQETQQMGSLLTGLGIGGGTADWQRTDEKLALAERLGRSPKLHDIAALCGKLMALAHTMQQSSVEEPPEQLEGITQGRHLARVLPSELVLFSDPATERLFAKKWIEGHLLQYELHAAHLAGQGPIIVALDSSGSMDAPLPAPGADASVTKEVWSKAVAATLVRIAQHQHRDIAILHFSGQVTASFHFAYGQASATELLDCLEQFDEGGTNFDAWMQEALRLVDTATFDQADVICISDGMADLSSEMEAAWQQRRRARGMRAFGILLGTKEEASEEEGPSVFKRITDLLIPLATLTEETKLAPMFASLYDHRHEP
ncbi:MAG: VWA domain-containing protein [Ktedonobacteraceae bacterium]|nr:VWA domain-containing protein [Ktedonobacteraceae bacterium]